VCPSTASESEEDDATNTLWESLDYKGRLRIQARIGRDHRSRVEGKDIYYNEQIRYLRKHVQTDINGGECHSQVEYRMLFQLYDPENNPIFERPVDVTNRNNNGSAKKDDAAGMVQDLEMRFNLISFSLRVPGTVKAWSHESPTLYRLEVILVQSDVDEGKEKCDMNDGVDGFVVDRYHCKIGFRSIEI